jgi:Zn-dependent M16 (insulinase) family peptidase
MKGGAYGAFAQPDFLEGIFSFSTYRDPNPLRSLDSIRSILQNFSGFDSLDKAVIGAYSRETRPMTGAIKSQVDFSRFLYGIEDRYRSRRLSALINIKEEEVVEVQKRLASQNAPCPVIITGEKDAEKAAAALGLTPETLPV